MSTTTDSATRTYKIDPSHSEVFFQVRHLVTKVRGRFSDFEGTINYSEANPEQSKVEFSIQTSSIDTNVSDRDTHLRSADFLDVERYPEVTFRSTAIRGAKESFELTGDLTIRGVTRPITLDASFEGEGKDPWGGTRASFSAHGKFDRRDFGLTWNVALETGGILVSNEVKINIEAQAVLQG